MEAMKGSFAVLITPMTLNQEVDLEGLKKNIDWMIEEGIPGICVCGNIVPKQAQRLYELVRDGKLEEAKELFEKLYPLLNMLENKPKAIQKVKASLNLMGRPAGPARLPRGPLNEEDAKLVNILKSLELI